MQDPRNGHSAHHHSHPIQTHYRQLGGAGAAGGPRHDHDYEFDSLLWDQLNDEQSREVQQHQSRFRAADPTTSRTNRWVIAQSMVWNTLERTAVATSQAWKAAQTAWRQHPYRNRNNNSMNWHGGTFDDDDTVFGIQELQSNEPLVTNGTTNANPSSNTSTNTTSIQNGRTNGHSNHHPPSTSSQEPRPNAGYPFVILQQYPSRLAIQRPRDHWGIVANMDVFLTHLYQYYYDRGLLPMICNFLVNIISLLFTLWLSRILLYNVNWQKLATCKDEQTCLPNWSDYYYDYQHHHHQNENDNVPYQPDDYSTWTSTTHWWLVQGYTILFLSYAGFQCWSFWQSLKHAWTCQYIMHEKLGISQRKLQGGAVAWDTVVEKLIQVQDSGEYRLALASLDPLKIAQRIMRKDNFLIAFWNHRETLLDVKVGARYYWCPSLEWSVHWCILNFMFNHKYEIRPAFLLDAASLERRLQVCGIVHALLLPFFILFTVLHFLFRNAYDFKTSKQYMGDKQWSSVALWTFREFNELTHLFERRLQPSYDAADDYLKLFGQSEWVAALGKLCVFLGGAVGGVLLVLGVMNDAILLHVQLWGRNLLWYAGIAGIVYSVGKALLPTKEAQPSVSRNLFADMDIALKNVSSHTHYYPEHWKGRGWDKKVHGQFAMLFDSKVKLFLYELISLILAPYLLFAKLSKCAPAICEFCTTIKAKSPGTGDVCGYSTFDFDTFKDTPWDGKTLGQSMIQNNQNNNNDNNNSNNNDNNLPAQEPDPPRESLAESILRTGNLEEATRQHPKPMAREGKMEKSFFSFQEAYPKWKCSPSGQSLVDRVEQYKQAQLANLNRERELYIEAAARQLETLAKLEGKTTSPSPFHLEAERLRDSYIPRVAPADADAGTHPSPHMAPPIHPPSPPPIPALQAVRPRRTTPSTIVPEGHEAPTLASDQPPLAASISPLATVPPTVAAPFLPTNLNLPQESDSPFQTSTANTAPFDPTMASTATTAANRDALRAELSTELRRLLTMSNIQPDSLLAGSLAPHPSLHPVAMPARGAERQYYWLERFHEHLEGQQRQEEEQQQQQQSNVHNVSTYSEPTIPRSQPLNHRNSRGVNGGSGRNNMTSSNMV